MRFLRTLALSAALILPACAQAPATKQDSKPTEYVVGSCSGRGFTVVHGVLTDKTLTLDYYMKDPQTVVKDEDPMVYDVTKKEVKKDDFTFDGTLETKDPETDIQIHGVLRNGRFAAIVLSHGNVAVVMYGYVGDVDHMVVTALDQYAFCKGLHAVDLSEVPGILNKYVDGELPSGAQSN